MNIPRIWGRQNNYVTVRVYKLQDIVAKTLDIYESREISNIRH